MKSRTNHSTADRERTGGIYAGAIGFTVVWVVGFLSDVPFRQTVWKGLGCGIVIYILTTLLLRIVLRLEGPEREIPMAESEMNQKAETSTPAAPEEVEKGT